MFAGTRSVAVIAAFVGAACGGGDSDDTSRNDSGVPLPAATTLSYCESESGGCYGASNGEIAPYIFMQYEATTIHLGITRHDPALLIDTTVLSAGTTYFETTGGTTVPALPSDQGSVFFTMPLCQPGGRDGNWLTFRVEIRDTVSVLNESTLTSLVSCRGDAECLMRCSDAVGPDGG